MASRHDFPFTIKDVVHLLGLNIRRPMGERGVYTDCPFCGDARGKLNVNYEKDVFRCNYCDAHGGMLALYAQVYNIDTAAALREITKALEHGSPAPVAKVQASEKAPAAVEQTTLAGISDIHHTLTLLLEFLQLKPAHRDALKVRGLSDEQIDALGYRSTPPPFLCVSLTERLIKMGIKVEGVPGFYINDQGRWTVRFGKRTAGILIPIKGIDGLVRGAQIRLDTPLEDGTKYLWLSSQNKRMGVSSGSPAHFVGNPYARTVYVTEGALKSDVAHHLMKRSFIAVAGANNLGQLDLLLAQMAGNGTQLVMESHDTDKFRNPMVNKGAGRIYEIARRHKLDARRFTWNPNYKGVDDWQLHLKLVAGRKEQKITFKDRYLRGLCTIEALDHEIEAWHISPREEIDLRDYLGLTQPEYIEMTRGDGLETMLAPQRKQVKYRVYQLVFKSLHDTIPFAFAGIDVMRKAGFDQPPAEKYRLVCEDTLLCPSRFDAQQVLRELKGRYGDTLPGGYQGRHVAPSDILELVEDDMGTFYYCNERGFAQVDFSPGEAILSSGT